MITKTENGIMFIDVPQYLTMWDLEKTVNKTMRAMAEPGCIYIINMENVVNVYSATIQFMLRISDRAKRLENEVFIINAGESVYNALNKAGVCEKIPICQSYPAGEPVAMQI